jgi:microcystin-dependent protein
VPLEPATIANVGGSQAHLNMQPFLTLSFCIALQGIFPSPN